MDVKARTYLVFGLWLFIRLTENKNGSFDFRQLDALMTHPSDTTDQLIGAVWRRDILEPAWIPWKPGQAGTKKLPGTRYLDLMENPGNHGKLCQVDPNGKGA